MNITLNIEAESSAELQEAINGLAVIVGGAIVPKSGPEKSKRGSKVTTQTDKSAESKMVEVGAVEDTEENQSDNVEENIPTVVELRAEAQKHGQTPEGKKAIKALLNAFESKSISDVPEDKRMAFMVELIDL